jgi:hypothetical protein
MVYYEIFQILITWRFEKVKVKLAACKTTVKCRNELLAFLIIALGAREWPSSCLSALPWGGGDEIPGPIG